MTQTTDKMKQKPRRVRGTALFNEDDSMTFTPYQEAPSTQLNVKTCRGGGKRWVTTGADPSRMISLKSKESSPDQYSDFVTQFNALTRDMKPKRPVELPAEQRVVSEDGLQCWLNEEKGVVTFTGTVDLSKYSRNWQAETLRLVQLVVRQLPASERFNRTINAIINRGLKK